MSQLSKGDRIITTSILDSHLGNDDIPVDSIGTIMAVHINDLRQVTTYVVRFDSGKDAHVNGRFCRLSGPLDEALS